MKVHSGVTAWIDEFSRTTQTNWNVKQTYSKLKIMQRKDFACHLGHFRKRPQSTMKSGRKNFGCPATITVKIKQINSMSRRRYSWVREGRPASINIYFRHNHPILNAQALSMRKLDPHTKDMFLAYFEQGMSAAVASEYHMHKSDLNDEGDDGPLSRADAAVNPKKRTVSHLYEQWRKTNLGDRHGEGMWDVLQQKVVSYESEGSKVVITKQLMSVVILTPIMQRAHGLATAAEVAFVDSTACCDSDNHSITFVLVRSVYGAVPAGVAITAGQSEVDYTSAFNSLKTLLGDQAFGGRGQPAIFITDDSMAERNALNSVWPRGIQRLCHFHVMQALWRWLWDSKHKIAKHDRKMLMQKFRNVLYSMNKDDALENFMSLKGASSAYSNFVGHVESLWKHRDLWCMAWRNMPELRGNHTNNYAEITVRLFKDHVLSRCKAYNLVALVDFVVVVMENFYRNRLERFANGRVSMHRLLLEKQLSSAGYIAGPDAITVLQADTGTTYLVPSESSTSNYEVDPVLGTCNCVHSMDGRCCKHQVAVYKFFNESFPSIPPVTAHSRYEAACLALGHKAPPRHFYEDLTSDKIAALAVNADVARVNAEAVQASAEDAQDSSLEQTGTFHNVSSNEQGSSACKPSSSNMGMNVSDSWKEFSTKMEDLLMQHRTDFCSDNMLLALGKAKSKLSKIRTATQLMSFVHSFGSNIPLRYRAGSAIRTQPTAISRRRP